MQIPKVAKRTLHASVCPTAASTNTGRVYSARQTHANQLQDGEPIKQHSYFYPLPPQQFQALFDSLFKVLFIFPSRYLFAIGLSPVFSLRWNLPPTLGCIPKQPDSSKTSRGALGLGPTGLSPSLATHSREFGPRPAQRTHL